MLALRELLQVIPNDVSTLAFGIACSTGPLLLSSGAPGTRRALPHSRIIVHQGSAGIGGTAVDVALRADHLRDARGDRVLDIHSYLLSEWVIWVGTAIDAGVANALIAQLLFREPDSPDSKVQLSVNCDSGDPPRHRNHLCGAGNRCRRRPARRGSRKETVRTAARSGRAPPARSPGTGAGPYPSSSGRPTRPSGSAEIETCSPWTAAGESTDCEPARITTAFSRRVRPSSSGSRTTLSRDADARR